MQSKSEFEFQLLRYNKAQRVGAKFLNFLKRTPLAIWGALLWLGSFFKKAVIGIGHFFKNLVMNFVHGTAMTKMSYLLMGFSQVYHKQFLRGFAFAAFQIIFVVYMATTGIFWMSQLGTLGVQGSEQVPNPSGIGTHVVYHDNSFKILLYGVLSLFFIVAFLYVWYMNVKQASILQQIDGTSDQKKVATLPMQKRTKLVLLLARIYGLVCPAVCLLVALVFGILAIVANIGVLDPTLKTPFLAITIVFCVYAYLGLWVLYGVPLAFKNDLVWLNKTSMRKAIVAIVLAVVVGNPFLVVAAIFAIIRIHRKEELGEKEGAKIRTDADDLRALVDRDFYKTLLAMPLAGIIIFMVIPIVFMVLVAFTNFDKNHTPPTNLFNWVGLDNFSKLFTWNTGGASFSATFGEILVWTLIWAFFATFSNYFLGMLVALLINKKGIKLKKMWRTILVLTITIPQFISLLYVSKMFGENGIINKFLMDWHWIDSPILFWKDANLARVTVIVINIWIGVPYLMLMVTGILMNIPADLYESAKIDGASPMQQYMKITLPYMLFVTGPYLLTSFTGNMNNFNVIYLLTGGGPANSQKYLAAGDTNLLITWLYSTTVSDNNYSLAAVIGIMVFVIVAIITGVVYNLLPSNKNEDDLA